jgi:hypothetical protein
VFEEKNNLLEKGEVTVIVDLGPLFQRWQEAGAKGVNVKVIEESTQVQVLKMPAKFMGLPMNANESQTILIKVDALKPQPTRTTETTIEERISETAPSIPMLQSIVYTLDLASPVTEQFEFVVSNSEKAGNVVLVFEEKNNLLEKGEVSVIVDLGPLFQRWQEAGAKGVNVKVIEDSTQVQVLKMPANFMDLPMDANESQTILIKVDALKPQPIRTAESTIRYVEEERISESTPSTPKQPSDVEESTPSTPKQPSDVEESTPSTPKQPSDVEESTPSTPKQPSDVEESAPSTPKQPSDVEESTPSTQPSDVEESAPSTPKQPSDVEESAPSTPKQPSDVEESAPSTQPSDVEESAPSTQPSDVEESTTSTLRQHSIHYFMDFASQMTEPFEIVVSNPEEPANTDLVFEENNKHLNNGEVKVIVDLGPLFPRWQAAGAKGFNVGILDEGPQVQLLKTPAKFMGLPMNASESQTILIKVDALKPMPTRTAETTTYQVVEEEREFTPILPRHSIHYFLDIASQMTEPFEMVVSNSEEPANIDLVFEENNKRLNKGEVRIIVDLGPLFPRWQTAGAKGLNVGILDKGPQVQLLKTPAKIMGIKMTAAESQIIKVKTDTFNPMPGKGTDTDGDDIKDVKEEPIPDEGDDIKDEEEPESTTILPRHSIHYFLDFASQTTAPFEMTVSNSEGPANIDLVFEENNKRLDKGEVRIIVDLGPLFPRWQAAGAKGINVGILDEGPQVQLLKTPAKIMGIKMTAAESQIIKVKTDTFNPMPKEGTDTDGDDIKDEPIQEEGDDIKDVKEEPIPESTTTPSTRRHRIHYILDFAGNMTEPFEVAVSNSEKDANVDLVFEGKSNILDKGEVNVIVDLGPLFPRWQAAGAKGVNVGILDEGPQVQLLKTPAQFKGIPMSASESQTIQIRVDAIQGTSREDSFSETTRDSTPSDGIPFDGEPRECVRLCAPPGSYYSY